jgi:hypothetical protein
LIERSLFGFSTNYETYIAHENGRMASSMAFGGGHSKVREGLVRKKLNGWGRSS